MRDCKLLLFTAGHWPDHTLCLYTRNKQSCILFNWLATPATKTSESIQPSAQNSRKGKQWRFGPDPHPQLPNPGTKEVPGELSMLLYNVEGIVSKLKDTSFVSFISCYDFVCLVETFVDSFTSTLFPSFTSFVSPAKKTFPSRQKKRRCYCTCEKSTDALCKTNRGWLWQRYHFGGVQRTSWYGCKCICGQYLPEPPKQPILWYMRLW